MISVHHIAVVIPCYRVEAAIASVLSRMPDYVDSIIAVVDASPDATAAVLKAVGDPRLTVLEHERNQGVGGAMATGFRHALASGANIVVKLDGDGQMDPARIAELVEPIAADDTDYAKANRFLHRAELQRMPAARLFGNVALTFLTKLASGYWHVFDPQNGYLAVHADFLRLLDLDRLATRRYFFENEMLIQLNIEQARVLDVPMPSVYGGEVSSLRISRVLTYFPYFLVRGFMSRLYQRYILRDFSVVIPLYLVGALLTLWGTVFGGYVWTRSIQSQVAATPGTVMLAVLPFLVGVQMLLQGLFVEIMDSPRGRKSRR